MSSKARPQDEDHETERSEHYKRRDNRREGDATEAWATLNQEVGAEPNTTMNNDRTKYEKASFDDKHETIRHKRRREIRGPVAILLGTCRIPGTNMRAEAVANSRLLKAKACLRGRTTSIDVRNSVRRLAWSPSGPSPLAPASSPATSTKGSQQSHKPLHLARMVRCNRSVARVGWPKPVHVSPLRLPSASCHSQSGPGAWRGLPHRGSSKGKRAIQRGDCGLADLGICTRDRRLVFSRRGGQAGHRRRRRGVVRVERRGGGRGGGRVRGLRDLWGDGLRDFHGRGRGRRRGWEKRGRGRNPSGGVRTGVRTVHLTDLVLKSLEFGAVDVQDPLQVAAHFALHLVDLLEGVKVLADDAPGFIRVRVVADDLGGDHERGNKEAVARRAAGGGEALLETGKEEQGGEDDGVGQASAMNSVRYEIREGRTRGRRRSGAGGGLTGWDGGTGEEGRYESAGEF